MKIRQEVVNVLEREIKVCDLAISKINEKLSPYEKEYGYSTEKFLELFNAGQLGDSHIFFKWYANAKAIKDWQNTKEGLKELLGSSECINA